MEIENCKIKNSMTSIKDIMTKNVIFCSPFDSIKEAARLMFLNGLSGLPVVDELDHVVGIVTEADMVKLEEPVHVPKILGVLGSFLYLDNPVNGDEIEKQLAVLTATKVSEVMTSDVITASPEDSIESLAEIFLHKKANPVPVTQDGELVGIVSRADIVKLIAGDKELAKKEWTALVKKQ